jgi:hypothetical protein
VQLFSAFGLLGSIGVSPGTEANAFSLVKKNTDEATISAPNIDVTFISSSLRQVGVSSMYDLVHIRIRFFGLVNNVPTAMFQFLVARVPPIIYNTITISSHVTGEKCLTVISLAMRWSSTGEREISI